MYKILIVEDDETLAQELCAFLTANRYEAEYLTEFDRVETEIVCRNPDMVLLDICLPGTDGQRVLRTLRKSSDVPVIMLTSKTTESDEVFAMSFGADDYITKPYNPSILLLHMEAVLKRYGKSQTESVHYRDVTFDPLRGVLRRDEDCVELTKNEAGILSYLFRRKGTIVTRDELIGYLWDSEEFIDDNTLTVNMNRVRKKLADFGIADAIVTKRGQGYILE